MLVATSFKWGFLVAVEMVCTSPVHSFSFIDYLTPLAPLWTFRNHFPPSLGRREERLCLPVACICVHTFCVSFISIPARARTRSLISHLLRASLKFSPASFDWNSPIEWRQANLSSPSYQTSKDRTQNKGTTTTKASLTSHPIQGPLTFASLPCSKFPNFSSHLKFILVRLVLLSHHTNYYTAILSGILVETMFLTPPVKSLPSSFLIY